MCERCGVQGLELREHEGQLLCGGCLRLVRDQFHDKIRAVVASSCRTVSASPSAPLEDVQSGRRGGVEAAQLHPASHL